MKILITGSNGQVGTSLVKQLELEKDIDFLALGRADLDITKQDDVFICIDKYKPNIIINLAAYTAVDKAEENAELAYDINSKGVEYLAQAANKVNAIMIHLSTDYVFSGKENSLYSEDVSPSPINIYGLSKLSGEQIIPKYCKRYIILRTSWVFGEYGHNFVKSILKLAEKRNKLNIVSDQYGGPTYSGDIAKALIDISRKIINSSIKFEEYGIYHFSGYPYVSWYQFAEIICKKSVELNILKKSPELTPLKTEEYFSLAKRPLNSKLNLGKIDRVFDIKPSNWYQSLDKFLSYIQNS